MHMLTIKTKSLTGFRLPYKAIKRTVITMKINNCILCKALKTNFHVNENSCTLSLAAPLMAIHQLHFAFEDSLNRSPGYVSATSLPPLFMTAWKVHCSSKVNKGTLLLVEMSRKLHKNKKNHFTMKIIFISIT